MEDEQDQKCKLKSRGWCNCDDCGVDKDIEEGIKEESDLLGTWYQAGQNSKAKTGLSLEGLLKDLFNWR